MNFWFLGSVAVLIGIRGLLKLYWGVTCHEPDSEILRPIQHQVGYRRTVTQVALFILGTAEITAACAALMWGLR